MIESAEKVVAVTIAEKLNSWQKIKVCGLDKIHVLITELEPDDEKLKPYRNAGITVL